MAEIVLELSQWAIPLFLILAPLYALFKGVDVYNVFCEGAAKGFALLVQILPFLLGMLIAIEVFSVSGAMQLVLGCLEPWANRLGLPPIPSHYRRIFCPWLCCALFPAAALWHYVRKFWKHTGPIVLLVAWLPLCRVVRTLPFMC